MGLSNRGDIKVNTASKPFVLSAIMLVFAGSAVGSIWMMSLLGANLPYLHEIFPLHKVFQVDGFLTLLIMGIGYMIVPRFRNANIPSTKLTYVTLLLILFSIALSTVSTVNNTLAMLSSITRLAGVTIFAVILLWMLRIQPRLLRLADYFIVLSIITLLASNLLQLLGHLMGNQSTEVQLWLLFPIMMIFGVEYKTLPSFLGFIRPNKKLSVISLGFAVASVTLAILSTIFGSLALSAIFNIILLGCGATFAGSVYIFGGFDNREILGLIQGEKKARYKYTVLHSRLAFIFLYAGFATGFASSIVANNNFALYDLAIHYTGIGFIGITIALYMPLMLPPITGRIIHFSKFNNIPILLVVGALAIRTVGDAVIMTQGLSYANYFLMTSGWMVVSALFVFVTMLHISMRETDSQVKGNPNI